MSNILNIYITNTTDLTMVLKNLDFLTNNSGKPKMLNASGSPLLLNPKSVNEYKLEYVDTINVNFEYICGSDLTENLLSGDSVGFSIFSNESSSTNFEYQLIGDVDLSFQAVEIDPNYISIGIFDYN